MGRLNLQIIIISILLISLLVVATNTNHIKAENCQATFAKDGDYDDDMLKDEWEINGIDVNNDNIVDLNLKKLGAKSDHKDLFVEVDYMKGFKPILTGDYPIFPMAEEAFKNSLVCNPDKSTGINLHIQLGEEIPHEEIIKWSQIANWKNKYFGTISDSNLVKEAKKQVFHYSLFIDKYSENKQSTGKADEPGMNFIVSLGVLKEINRTPWWQVKTFMHEFGHNLDLHHGGWDSDNFKPNYLSVMNYFFQSPSFGRALDYASCKVPILKESSFDERQGVKVESHSCKEKFPITGFFQEGICRTSSGKLDPNAATRIALNTGYDVDGSGSRTVISYDLNCDGRRTSLSSNPNTDWLQLDYISIKQPDERSLMEDESSLMEDESSFMGNESSFITEPELTVDQSIALNLINIKDIFDTLNNISSSEFQSNSSEENMSSLEDTSIFGNTSIDQPENNKQLLYDILGFPSNNTEEMQNSLSENISDNNNNTTTTTITQAISEYDIDGAIKDLEAALQYVNNNMKKGGDQQKLSNSINFTIERLKDQSCTYVDCN
jgi:hypothetical protein